MSERRTPATEVRLARAAVGTAAAVGCAALGVAWAVAGWAGALSALVGVGLVLVLFAVAALAIAKAAPYGAQAVLAATVGAATARLVLYLGVLVVLLPAEWVHGPSLALATLAALLAGLTAELVVAVRSGTLWWVGPGGPERPASDGPAGHGAEGPTEGPAEPAGAGVGGRAARPREGAEERS